MLLMTSNTGPAHEQIATSLTSLLPTIHAFSNWVSHGSNLSGSSPSYIGIVLKSLSNSRWRVFQPIYLVRSSAHLALPLLNLGGPPYFGLRSAELASTEIGIPLHTAMNFPLLSYSHSGIVGSCLPSQWKTVPQEFPGSHQSWGSPGSFWSPGSCVTPGPSLPPVTPRCPIIIFWVRIFGRSSSAPLLLKGNPLPPVLSCCLYPNWWDPHHHLRLALSHLHHHLWYIWAGACDSDGLPWLPQPCPVQS